MKLRYSSGVIKGCYFSIEPVTGARVIVTLITPFGKLATVKDDTEEARSWVDTEVRNYQSRFYGMTYDN